MTIAAHELNIDGLPGPTHNYAGLSPGNLASQAHKHNVSNPRAAALESLAKMKMLAELGVPQAIMPPQLRPDLMLLRRVGFTGNDPEVITRAAREAPAVLAAASSASSMWTANAATVRPSADGDDSRVHFTPANLVSELHRSVETAPAAMALRHIFEDASFFTHHDPLPGSTHLCDEGAANHTRFCRDYGERGVHLFVYGKHALDSGARRPRRHPARQSFEASGAIARLHDLSEECVVFAQQHPDAIDAGVFHNDVVAVGDRDVLFYHRSGFIDPVALTDMLRYRFERICGGELRLVEVASDDVPLDEAVRTYLFNSQIVRCSDGSRAIVLPQQCRDSDIVHDYVTSLVGPDKVIQHAHYVDLLQSMRNGGGPACLRLRVVLTDLELAAMHPGVRLDNDLHTRLEQWVNRYYRTELKPGDLADPQLAAEARDAHNELLRILERHDAR